MESHRKVLKSSNRIPPNAGKGRKKGVPNKSTESMRKAWLEAFDNLGGIPSLVRWGQENPDDFYKCASKLITVQTELTGAGGGPVEYVVERVIIDNAKKD